MNSMAMSFAALILSGLLASRVSKRIVEPLNHLDLEHPMENDTYEELSPLLVRIHQQNKKIGNQLQTLQRRNDEFDQITASMHEGLVLLDGSGAVLSLNPAAEKLFGADDGCVGKPFCAVDRKPEMTSAVEEALRQGHSELKAQRKGRTYQFLLSRISSGSEVIGFSTVLFFFAPLTYRS
mgnify:CR=1 FL=1